jgi:hypothetical protein
MKKTYELILQHFCRAWVNLVSTAQSPDLQCVLCHAHDNIMLCVLQCQVTGRNVLVCCLVWSPPNMSVDVATLGGLMGQCCETAAGTKG